MSFYFLFVGLGDILELGDVIYWLGYGGKVIFFLNEIFGLDLILYCFFVGYFVKFFKIVYIFWVGNSIFWYLFKRNVVICV